MDKTEIINRFLKDEKILWQGAPSNVPYLNKSDIWLIPFTLLFGGAFIGYAIISAIMMFAGKSIMFALTGITLLLMGTYILFFRFWYRKKRIARQLYFVTDKRVFAFDTMRDDIIFDILLEDTDLYLGYKSLIISDINAIGDFIYNLGLDIFFRKFAKETPSFKYIDDINNVSRIIISAKETVEENDNDSIFI